MFTGVSSSRERKVPAEFPIALDFYINMLQVKKTIIEHLQADSMLRYYGYLGLFLIILAEINFSAAIEPFALWYIPIVWYGYIFFVDSLVYRLKKGSLIASYPSEFLFLAALSLPFWLIFESYNTFTGSWYYVHYAWYVHLVNFTTIMPAILETFSLFNALGIGRRFDKKKDPERKDLRANAMSLNAIRLLVAIGAFIATIPIFLPILGFPFMWIGLFLFLDPLNYLTNRPSIIKKVSEGRNSLVIRLFLAGITMGFFWEFWNYQAYPKWMYNMPSFIQSIRLFEMPLLGYLGYLPFSMEVFLFFALFRSFAFKNRNALLSM